MNAPQVENANSAEPHSGQPVLSAGTPAADAAGAMILIHGRGASAASILTLAEALERPQFAFLAPQARGNSWYPNSFLVPVSQNEPYLTSALALISQVVAQTEAAGIPRERTILLGFSQGACLASEFVARHPLRYGGLAALSGGLIGRAGDPPGAGNQFTYSGSLDGTPVFLGCSDVDPHIPRERVEKSAAVFRTLGAAVSLSLYPGMPHTVNQDELAHVRTLLDQL